MNPMLVLRKFLPVVLLAAVALLASTPVSAQPDTDPKGTTGQDTKWMVNDAEFYFKVNVRQLMAAELVKGDGVKAIKDALNTNNEVKTILEAANLDVTKDIDSILASGTGTPKDAKVQVIMRGRFDKDKVLKAVAKREEVKMHKEGEIQVFEISPSGDQSVYGAVMNAQTIVLTQSKAATVALVKTGGTRAATLSKGMRGALARFNGKESMAMALVVNEDLKKTLQKAPKLGDSAAKLQTITVALTLTDSIALNINGVTNDQKAARQLATLLEGARATGKMLLAGLEEVPAFVPDLLDLIKIAGGKDSVTLDLRISKETIQKIKKDLGGS